MDVADDVRTRQTQQFVVAFDVFVKILESLALTPWAGVAVAPVLRLAELEALDHGAHGAIENGYAFFEDAWQGLRAGVGDGLHLATHCMDFIK